MIFNQEHQPGELVESLVRRRVSLGFNTSVQIAFNWEFNSDNPTLAKYPGNHKKLHAVWSKGYWNFQFGNDRFSNGLQAIPCYEEHWWASEDSQFKFQTTAVTVQRLPNILRIWQEDQGKLIFSKEFARKTFLKFFSSRQCSNGVRARVLAWVLMCERQVKVTWLKLLLIAPIKP